MSEYYAADKLDGNECPICNDGTCNKKNNYAKCDNENCGFSYP